MQTFQQIKDNYLGGQNIFRRESVGVLFEHITELDGRLEMWAEGADESALRLANCAAQNEMLEKRLWEVENFPALADPHLFENLANEMKGRNALKKLGMLVQL